MANSAWGAGKGLPASWRRRSGRKDESEEKGHCAEDRGREGCVWGAPGPCMVPGTPRVGAGLGEGTEADQGALKAEAKGWVFDLSAVGRH